MPSSKFLRRFEMQRVERRYTRSVGIYPDEISHPSLGNKPRDLICGVPVRIYKKSAVALADVFYEEVNQERGFPHSAHTLDVAMFGGVY